jgi:photosystem II stability/assembly factor-like uncharacterized protein
MKGIWEPVNYSEDIDLNDVFFVNTETGWVAGEHATLLKTTDGGTTWNVQLGGDTQSQEQAVRDLHFVNETTGWATQRTSSYTNLLRTTDGENWEPVGTIEEHYTDYFFTSETEGVFATGDKVYQTTDGGQKWTLVYTCAVRAEVDGLTREMKCEVQRMHFPSPTVGFAIAVLSGLDLSAILKTEDGGSTWNLAGLLDGYAGYGRESGIFFTDENNGVVRPKSGKGWITADGGQTWKGLIATTLGQSILFADPEVGWSFANLCVGMGCENARLSYTTNGGRQWTSRSFTFPAGVQAFSLPRRDRGYAVGAHGMVYRYRVVPVQEQVARAIQAPAMPGIETALDEQTVQLQQQLQTLEQVIEQKTGQQLEITGTTEVGLPAEAGDAAAATAAEPGLAEQVAAQQLNAIESTLESISAEVPKFSGRYRNLNLIFGGLQLVGQLFGQTQGMNDAFGQLRSARDVASISAALNQLTGQMQMMLESSKTALQTSQ